MKMAKDHDMKKHHFRNSRNRFLDDNYSCYDNWIDGMSVSSSVFEVLNSERSPQIVPLPPFAKTPPSKWDDAEKWIASPTGNRCNNGQSREQYCGVGSQRNSTFGSGSRQTSIKVVEVSPEKMVSNSEEVDTKWMKSSKKIGARRLLGWESDACLVPDSYNKPVIMDETCSGKTASRSVSMRDMGTEMSPMASKEPSRTGTPLIRAMSSKSSPTSSQLMTPRRGALTVTHNVSPNKFDLNKTELSEKEAQMKTRREIMLLGNQLGKMNIAAWASKEGEKDALTLLQNEELEQPEQSVMKKRVTAWEDEEKAKYMSRFKRLQIKIQAWENHEKAKAEAEMRKIEVEVERMRIQAHKKLMKKNAVARDKAEKKLAVAKSKLSYQISKTAQQAEFIRRTGDRTPFCCSWFS